MSCNAALPLRSVHLPSATNRRCPPAPTPCCSVIHQPSSEVFALFDKLCLLSDGYVSCCAGALAGQGGRQS